MEALYMLCTFTVQITFALILMMPLYVPLKISQSHQHWRKRAKFTGAYSCGKLITTANKQTTTKQQQQQEQQQRISTLSLILEIHQLLQIILPQCTCSFLHPNLFVGSG